MVEWSNWNPEILGSNLGHEQDEHTCNLFFNRDNVYANLKISSYLSMSETDYIPWRVFLYHSTLIAKLLEHRSGFLLFAVNKNQNDCQEFFLFLFRITQIVLLKDYLQIGF